VEETVSAGFTTAGIVFIFSATGMLRWFTCVIPTPVVKGIQVGAGLSLVLSAGSSLLQPLGWVTPNWGDNLLWALLAFIALLLTRRLPRVPYALLVFAVGLVLAVLIAGLNRLPSFKSWNPQTFVPSWSQFSTGALDAGLGQVPLTTLNSIIAVSYLSADLLPNLPAPSVTSIGLSVAMMNLIGGWFGAMPVCHGSGGLAAQYRFGARSGASIIILGSFKILLGLLFGESLVGLLREYPKGLLGVMVLAAGLELAKVGESLNYGARDLWEVSETVVSDSVVSEGDQARREIQKNQRHLSDEERMERWTVMFITIAGLLAFRNDGVGFVAGMLCHWSNQLSRAWSGWEGIQKRRDERRSRRTRSAMTGDEEEPLLLDEEENII
jgi:hypothetical protein